MERLTLKVTASAPAKIILCGEHAVVFYEPAIAMAIDKQAYVTVEPRDDKAIYIKSRNLRVSGRYEKGRFKPGIGGLAAKSKLNPIRTAVEKTFQLANKKAGLNVLIDSDIPVATGLGSSAAVAVATIAATGKLLDALLSKEKICSIAYEVEKTAHGHPSGIDNYISTYGGITVFRRGERLTPLEAHANILLVIGNTKVSRSTGLLVGHVGDLKEAYPNVINPVIDAIGRISISAAQALQDGELKRLGELMNVNHGLLSALGVSSEELDRLVYAARRAGALGAKLTGAGGGGCMIALVTPEKLKQVRRAIRQAGGITMLAKKIDRGVQVWEKK